MEFTLFYSKEKKIQLFKFSCHLCHLHMRSYSQLQNSVAFSRQENSLWIPVSFKIAPFHVARLGILSQLAPTLGRHVLAWGTKQ